MPPLSVMIKPVSGNCNMRCTYCFYADALHHRQESSLTPMSLDTLEKLIRRALAYADGSLSLVFQGGEPTLAGLPFYQAAVRLIRQYNARHLPVSLSIQTNGCHITPEWAAFFQEHGMLVGLSMDGCQEVHDAHRKDAVGQGTYHRVAAAADILYQAGVSCNLLAVVTDTMVNHQEEVLSALSRFGYVQLIPCIEAFDGQDTESPRLSEQGWTQFLQGAWRLYQAAAASPSPISIRIFDNLLRILRGEQPDTCAMVGHCAHNLMVESNGDVYPCDFYGVDEWRLGNIHEENFRLIACCPREEAFLRCSLPVPEPCQVCPHYFLCRNGCMRDRDPHTGLNRWCGSMKSFLGSHTLELRHLAHRFDPNAPRSERRAAIQRP